MRTSALGILLILLITGFAAPAADPDGNEVRVTRDVIYGHKAGMALTLDVYVPATPHGAGVLFMNSGGWYSPLCQFLTDDEEPVRIRSDAELDRDRLPCRDLNPEYLAARGFAVFDVRHGSAPHFTVTDATSDVRRALAFVRRRAAHFGVDPARLGIWGASAGGQLALALGLGDLPRGADTGNGHPPVAAIVAYFAPDDLDAALRARPEMLPDFPALQGVSAEALRAVSPVHVVTPGDPPTLIIHGDADELVPISMGQAIHRALLDAGIEAELLTMAGAGHGFTGADADRALAASLAWFTRHLVR